MRVTKEQMYIIPYSFENVSFNWRNDMFGEVGIKTPPTTWDEWYTTVTLFKEKRADADAFPTSFVGFLWTDVGALITAATDKPYGDNGLLDWLSTGTVGSASSKVGISEELTPSWLLTAGLNLSNGAKSLRCKHKVRVVCGDKICMVKTSGQRHLFQQKRQGAVQVQCIGVMVWGLSTSHLIPRKL